MKNIGAYMTALDKMEFRELDMPVAGEGQVVVKLEYVGICGSDVHYFHHGRVGNFVVEGDFMLGHECAGVVDSVGAGVKKLKVGDKVALEPGIPCGKCEFCKSGKYNLCPDVIFLATPPVQGCYMNYIAYPEEMCFKLPDHVTTKEGALVEPFAVGLHSVFQGGVKMGDKVVILGTGCIGLMTMLAAKASGAADITVIDVVDKRLEYAKKLGATRVFNAKNCDVLAEMATITEGAGVDIVFETAGAEVTIRQTPYLVKRGGTIVLVGMSPKPEISYDLGELMSKEARIETVFRYRNLYPRAINAIANGDVDVSSVASHEFAFEDIQKGFEAAINDKENVVKAVIRI